jgi:beta-glucosidase
MLSVPFWLAGDMAEALAIGNAPFADVTLEEGIEPLQQPLDVRGFSVSTYQNSSNSEFCRGSDWHRHIHTLFGGNEASAQFKGVDLLTKKGREMVANAVIHANGSAIRFSVEWADVRSEDGSIDTAALQKYVELAQFFKEQGIQPIITLHHFVTPLDSEGRSLLETDAGAKEYIAYATAVIKELAPYVTHFMTFNEPNVNAVENYILGDFPAGGVARMWQASDVTHRMLAAHERVYDAVRDLKCADGEAPRIGITHQALTFLPTSRWNYLARITSFVMTYCFHESFMRWAESHQSSFDLLGVQFYTIPLIGGVIPDSMCRQGEEMVESMRFRFFPEGILAVLREIGRRLPDKPLIVTETGTAGENSVAKPNDMDERRRMYMSRSIQAVTQAANEGIPIVGYMPWTLFDNIEWHHGFSRAHGFGLVARNPETNDIRYTGGIKPIQDFFSATGDA